MSQQAAAGTLEGEEEACLTAAAVQRPRSPSGHSEVRSARGRHEVATDRQSESGVSDDPVPLADGAVIE